ncbi:RNA-directed DNA polymerase from mobile element jockey [Eumeta japonica]|uniref:RNA-directed DNA polymerase from mobile element jockey n=1 Tax=Eumeta variegata TaxID=151549 RepID=A0A4C1XNX2_EUMVA|nr:RNA-directed DNA polymerase from mobile element jockey [Eumeta japonica]
MSLRNKCTLYKVCIRPVMTYAAPVFAHANPKALYQLQVLQNNFCRRASGAPWYVRNDILHRDLELPRSPNTWDMSKSSSTQLLTIPTHYYKQPYPTSLPSTSFHPKATECPFRPTGRTHR